LKLYNEFTLFKNKFNNESETFYNNFSIHTRGHTHDIVLKKTNGKNDGIGMTNSKCKKEEDY